MSWFGSIFGSLQRRTRRARRAAVEGDYREAAMLYAEAGEPEEAARALRTLAERSRNPGERESLLRDALHWLGPTSPQRGGIEGLIGASILNRAAERREHSRGERQELEQAARLLENGRRFGEAAAAWELIGRRKDSARCLERAGDLEGLESLLDEVQAETDDRRAARDAMRSFEMSHAVGARIEGRRALEQALVKFGNDPAITAKLRELRGVWLPEGRVRLRIAEHVVDVVGHLPLTVGRSDADLLVRGTSVSRKHAEIDVAEGGFSVRDLGSSNGTLVEGLSIRAQLTLSGDTDVGLGEDVDLSVSRTGEGLRLEVVRGLDRGLVCLAGPGELMLPGTPACVTMVDGVPELRLRGVETVELDRQTTTGPIQLLKGDEIRIAHKLIEVLG